MEYWSVEDAVKGEINVPDVVRCDGTVGVEANTRTYYPPPSELLIGPDSTFHRWRNAQGDGRRFHDPNFKGVLMHPYSHGYKADNPFLIRRKRKFWHKWDAWYHNGKSVGNGGVCCDAFRGECSRSWTEVLSIDSASGIAPGFTLSSFFEHDVNNAVAVTQTEAYASASSGLDLLTEVAELGKSVDLVVGAVSTTADLLTNFKRNVPLRIWGALKRLNVKQMRRHGDKAMRTAADAWLQTIYGIMPMTYLVTDVMDTWKQRNRVYESYHSKRTVRPHGYPNIWDALLDTYLVTEWTGSIEVQSTVRRGYELGALQRVTDRVSTNLAKTAWELIPLSFVIDWFLNVGDAITAQTSLDVSTYQNACTSVKREKNSETRFVDKSHDRSDLSRVLLPNDPCGGPINSVNSVFIHFRDIDVVAHTHEERSFERTLFSKPAMRVSPDVFINWKRMVTSAALTYRPIRRLLSRI